VSAARHGAGRVPRFAEPMQLGADLNRATGRAIDAGLLPVRAGGLAQPGRIAVPVAAYIDAMQLPVGCPWKFRFPHHKRVHSRRAAQVAQRPLWQGGNATRYRAPHMRAAGCYAHHTRALYSD
jgi:hypothetical protein